MTSVSRIIIMDYDGFEGAGIRDGNPGSVKLRDRQRPPVELVRSPVRELEITGAPPQES